MADGVTTQTAALATIPTATKIATDDAGASGHIQLVKLAYSADGVATLVDADSNGLKVAGTFTVNKVTATGDSAGLTTATTLYTAGDQLGTIISLTNMAATSGGAGWIGSLTLLCDAPGVIGAVRAWFFTGSVSLSADNSGFAISDADAAKCIGTVTFPSPTGATNNAIATVPGVNLDYQCDATTLFVALETLSTHTAHFAAADDLHITARAFRH